MKRKVAAEDLSVGMYVAELDRPWEAAPFESPFELQGFAIHSVDDLLKVKNLCRYVYIDPNLGLGATRYLSDEHQFRFALNMIQEISRDLQARESYEERTPMEEEVVRASEILNDTHRVYEQVLNDLKAGHQPNAGAVKNVVGELVESVLRNASAASWLARLKKRDQLAYSHSISVCVLGLTLGRYLGLTKKELNTLGVATLLQDVGKISIPLHVLSKVSRLEPVERDLVQLHVRKSVSLIRSMRELPNHVVNITAMHHERFDGTGYPQGLSRSEISLLASIAGLVDSYEAMTSVRPYRRAKTSFEALMELYDERDRAHPGGLIEHFIQCVGIFPVGGFVRLNTGEVAVVVQRNRIQQLKPKVMILTDRKGQKLQHPQTVDLAAQFLLPSRLPRSISQLVNPTDYQIDPGELFL